MNINGMESQRKEELINKESSTTTTTDNNPYPFKGYTRTNTFTSSKEYHTPKENQLEDEVGYFEAIKGGFKSSWFVTYARLESNDEKLGQVELDDKELRELLRKNDWDTARASAVLRGASTKEDLKYRQEVIDEISDYRKRLAKSGLGVNVVSSLADVVADPTTYLSAGSSLGSRALIGFATGAGTSFMSEEVTGADTNWMVDGFLTAGVASLLGGVGDKAATTATNLVDDSARRATIITNAVVQGKEVDVLTTQGLKGSKKANTRYTAVKDKISKALPTMTIRGALEETDNPFFTNLRDKFYNHRGAGELVRDAEGNLVTQHVNISGKTGEELLNDTKVDFYNYLDLSHRNYNKLHVLGFDTNEVETHLINFIEGGQVPQKLLDCPEFIRLAEASKSIIKKYGDKAEASGFIKATDRSAGDRYVPRMIDGNKVADIIDERAKKLGSVEKATSSLVKDIKAYLLNGVYNNKELLLKFKNIYMEHLKEVAKKEARKASKKATKDAKVAGKKVSKVTPAPAKVAFTEAGFKKWLAKQAGEDATAYVKGKTIGDNKLGARNPLALSYDYRISRNPWDTSSTSSLLGGKSLNNFRLNLTDTIEAFTNRVTGDEVIKNLGFDSHTKFLKAAEKAIDKVETKGTDLTKGKSQADKLRNVAKLTFETIYGKSHRDMDTNETWMAAVADSLRNLTFFSKNAYMGLANYFEQGEAWKAYGAMHMIKTIPGMWKLFGNWTKGGMTNEEALACHAALFGKEVRPLGLFRDYSRDSMKLNLQRFNGNRAKAMLVAGTQNLVNISPFTKFLNYSSESIPRMAQEAFLGELVRASHNLKKKGRGFLDDKILARNNISKEDYEHLLEAVRKFATVDDKGKITLNSVEAITGDVQALSTLRRLGDYVSNEVIQKNNLEDMYLWAGSSSNPFIGLLLQFKNFAIQSFNKRILRSMNRIAEGDLLGQGYSAVLSVALGTMSSLANSGIMMLGMTDEQKEEYMLKTYGITSLDEADESTMMQVGLNGFLRSNMFASTSLVLNSLGVGTTLKTTAENAFKGDDEGYERFEFGRFITDMMPAASVITNATNIVRRGAYIPFKYTTDEDYTDADAERDMRYFARDVRNITNFPVIRNVVHNMVADEY